MTAAQSQTAVKQSLRRWRTDLVAFVREVLHVEQLDPWQEKTLRAVPHNMRLAMKACKGPGKSAVESWIAWWCLTCFFHPKVVATSITADNLRDGLWAEMSKWQQKNEFLKSAYTWTAERIFLNSAPETWWMSARTWPKSADPSQQANTLAGIHADVVMFLIDEAGGIPDAVVAAAEAALANADPKENRYAWLVLAGNPTHLTGPLYRACTSERDLWWTISISSAPNDPDRTPRVSKQWAQEQIDKYGAESPFVLVNVFGQFPPGQSNTLIGRADALAAQRRVYTAADLRGEPNLLGVDVARFGDDESVILRRQGQVVFPIQTFRNLRTTELAERVKLEVLKLREKGDDVDAIFVDATGIGAGVVDNLIKMGHDDIVIAVEGASKPALSKPLVRNKRVECWWKMAEHVRHASLPPGDEQLIRELCTPEYWFDSAGRICLESKEEMKARGESSPNKADAYSVTFAQPVDKKVRLRELDELTGLPESELGRCLTDYDPFSRL